MKISRREVALLSAFILSLCIGFSNLVLGLHLSIGGEAFYTQDITRQDAPGHIFIGVIVLLLAAMIMDILRDE